MSRAVTTDAASAHAEKESVPEVRLINWDEGSEERRILMDGFADGVVGG